MMLDTTAHTWFSCWPTEPARQLAGAGVVARCKTVLQGLVQHHCFWLRSCYAVGSDLARLQWVVPLLVRVALFRIQSP